MQWDCVLWVEAYVLIKVKEKLNRVNDVIEENWNEKQNHKTTW